MAAPFVTLEHQLDPGPFALADTAAERFDQRLNVGKDDRRRGWSREDGCQRLPVLGVHAVTIA